MRPAVFLDRDGTLIAECGYLKRLDAMALFSWTADAVRLLNRAGFPTVVITNQAAVGRGIVEDAFVGASHRELSARLARGGAAIDAYYYCPHAPDAALERYRQSCRCRKPGPGLIEQACREMGLDPARSVMVGDRWIDVACGRAAGTRALLVRSGHGAGEAARAPEGLTADAILDNVMEAVGWILRSSAR